MATAVVVGAEVRTRVIEDVASPTAVIILSALFNTLLMSPSILVLRHEKAMIIRGRIRSRCWRWCGSRSGSRSGSGSRSRISYYAFEK